MPEAIFSVYDKTGIIDLACALFALGWDLFGTEGTAKFLSSNGFPVKSVAEYTGSPEMLGGRVKTLHPTIMQASGWLYTKKVLI